MKKIVLSLLDCGYFAPTGENDHRMNSADFSLTKKRLITGDSLDSLTKKCDSFESKLINGFAEGLWL